MSPIELLNEYALGIAVPMGLVLIGIFYCIKLRFFHIRHPILLIRSLFEKSGDSGTSPFRAVMLALAGTLGVGNIVGVASAVYLGGAGAVFWMWVSALCAMILKYAEIVLALLYRRRDKNGEFYGGAMYYIRDIFAKRKSEALGALLASVFAVFCIINAVSMGSMIQSNAISGAIEGVWNISPVAVGVALSVLTLVVISRGTGGILKLTDLLVPVMSLGYFVLSMAIIVKNSSALPSVMRDIVGSAFSARSAASGVLGFLLSGSLRYGAMRGLLSNEAGCGTAPAAHAVSNTDCAAKQGIWGIFEVFVDTIVLCSMTAFVLLLGYDSAAEHGGNFIMMTFSAYSHFLGDAAEIFMCIAVIFFGFATIACWAHYGFAGVRYFSESAVAKKAFTVIYCVSVLAGAVMSTDAIWQTADLAIGVMTVINLFALVYASDEVRSETEKFLLRKREKK